MKDFQATFVNTDGVPFPLTASVNSSGGGATDGTEFVKVMVDDFWGWMQDLLYYTDDTPNGNSEVGASQLLNSIKKMLSNITEVSSNTTHTVEDWNKRSMLVIEAGCTSERLEGGVGCNRSNRLYVYNHSGASMDLDFGAVAATEVISIQNGQWVEFFYDDDDGRFIYISSNKAEGMIISTDESITIEDWIPSGTTYLAEHGATTKQIIVTLPTLADNQNKIYNLKAVGNGVANFYGEGGTELIEGVANQYIFSDGDLISIFAEASEWKILKHTLLQDSGWLSWSDHTSGKYPYCTVTMDTVVGTFEIGELVREYSDAGHTTATGKYGVVWEITATTLTLLFAAGTGVFTNNYYLLGMNSNATSLVNLTNKNVHGDIYVGLGIHIEKVTTELFLSTAGSIADIGKMSPGPQDAGSTNPYGVFLSEVDTSNVRMATSIGGILTNAVLYDTEDIYYKLTSKKNR